VAAAGERERRESDEVRRAAFARQLAGYQPLLEKLALTVEQRATFNDLLAANLQRHADLREVGRAQGARPVDVDIEALEAEADAALSARIGASFGSAVQAAFLHFEKTGPVREFVHHLHDALATTATPLTPSQDDQLVELIAQHSRGADGRVTRNPRGLAVDAALGDPRCALAPAQADALRRVVAELR
jgi:hypothetical protein